MPLYEYQCMSCSAQFQSLVMKKEHEDKLVCPECGSPERQKLISLSAYHVSGRARIESFDPGAQRDDSFYKDSRNIGLSAEKISKKMGVDLGRGFKDKLDRLRSDPGSVLKESE